MKYFIKKNPNNTLHYSTGRKIEVKNITENSFDILVWGAKNIQGDDTIYDFEEDPILNLTVNKNDVLFDNLSKNKIEDDHTVIVGYLQDFLKDSIRFTNLFAHTKQIKSSIGYLISTVNVTPLFYIVIPFKDSSMSEWTFIADAREFKAGESDISNEVNLDKGITAAQGFSAFFPEITLSKSNNEITAQLSVAKSGVEIYFETTAGYLNKTRALTDATGKTTVKVFGDELEGKVKVGFKHFSGKAEVNI